MPHPGLHANCPSCRQKRLLLAGSCGAAADDGGDAEKEAEVVPAAVVALLEEGDVVTVERTAEDADHEVERGGEAVHETPPEVAVVDRGGVHRGEAQGEVGRDDRDDDGQPNEGADAPLDHEAAAGTAVERVDGPGGHVLFLPFKRSSIAVSSLACINAFGAIWAL